MTPRLAIAQWHHNPDRDAAWAAMHAAGLVSATEPLKQMELHMDRDSIEWLEMMAEYGPLDCRPTFSRIAEELRQLRAANETLTIAARRLPVAAE